MTLEWLSRAAAGGGIVLAVVAGSIGFLAGDTANPGVVDEVREEVAPSPSDNPCPAGWEYSLITDHAVSRTCYSAPYVAVLFPTGGMANYGINTTGGPDAPRVACLNIPNWPADRCEP
ncbi:MAG: hypothetical protein U0990_11915 [Candidatus Nanopelagicales bacterium]|nr:hypothetical protein [Candidatus Nanopelagicales bacterium]